MNEINGLNFIENNQENWSISLDGPLISRYKRNVSLIPPDALDRTIATAARILSHCPNPQNLTSYGVTILALGKVQSGKTASYTALIALAAQAGYKTVIVLAGVTDEILQQTANRLIKDLGVYGADRTSTIHLFTGNSATLRNQHESIKKTIERPGHTALLVAIKRNVGVIRDLLQSFSNTHNPTLIIDDEADQASLNTNANKPDVDPSRIYQGISELRALLPLHGFVSYTATPQANILLDQLDTLRPKYIELVEPGESYCGGAVFFGPNENNYIRHIPEGELDKENKEITPSLETSLTLFLVGAAIRHLKTPKGAMPPHYSMLIHTSSRKASHSDLLDAVRRKIEHWRLSLQLPPTDPAFQETEEKFKNGYKDFEATVDEIPRWEETFSRVRTEEIEYMESRVINSSLQNLSPTEFPYQFENIIVVGGEKLGRGLTIPGLAVVYLARDSAHPQADTLEQRARWFGYNRDYLDLCRIFLTNQLIDEFRSLTESEEDLWERMRRNQRQGLNFEKWKPMLLLNLPHMRATRSNVVRAKAFSPQGWETETKLVTSEEDSKHNIQIVNSFKNGQVGALNTYGQVKHWVIKSCPIDAVIKLFENLHYDLSDWDLGYYGEYLMHLKEGEIVSNIEVIFMNNGEVRKRTAQADGTLPRAYLMQGHSDGMKKDDSRFYPGDEELHNGSIQLQVHTINYTDTQGNSTLTTALALYVPENDPRFNLSYIVRDDEYGS